MRVLLDVGVSPRLRLPLQRALGDVSVETAVFRGWRDLTDNELLARAGSEGFSALITTDKRLGLEHPDHAVVIIAVDDNRVPALLRAVSEIAGAVRSGEQRLISTLSR